MYLFSNLFKKRIHDTRSTIFSFFIYLECHTIHMHIISIMYYYPKNTAQCYITVEKSGKMNTYIEAEKLMDDFFTKRFPSFAKDYLYQKYKFETTVKIEKIERMIIQDAALINDDYPTKEDESFWKKQWFAGYAVEFDENTTNQLKLLSEKFNARKDGVTVVKL